MQALMASLGTLSTLHSVGLALTAGRKQAKAPAEADSPSQASDPAPCRLLFWGLP